MKGGMWTKSLENRVKRMSLYYIHAPNLYTAHIRHLWSHREYHGQNAPGCCPVPALGNTTEQAKDMSNWRLRCAFHYTHVSEGERCLWWSYHHHNHLYRQTRYKKSDYCKWQPLSTEPALGLWTVCWWQGHRFQERYMCGSGCPRSKLDIHCLKSFSVNMLGDGESYHLIVYRWTPFQAGNRHHPDSSLPLLQAIPESLNQPKLHSDISAHQSMSMSPSSPGPAR